MALGENIERAYESSNLRELNGLNRRIAHLEDELMVLLNRRDELLGQVERSYGNNEEGLDRLMTDLEAA